MIKNENGARFTPKQAAALAMRMALCTCAEFNLENDIWENATQRERQLINDQFDKLTGRFWRVLENIELPEDY